MGAADNSNHLYRWFRFNCKPYCEMSVTPLAGFVATIVFCEAPLRVSRARRLSDNQSLLIYEFAGALASNDLALWRQEMGEAGGVLDNTANGVTLALPITGTPLCAWNEQAYTEAFLTLALQLAQALGQAHDSGGFYRYLNGATVCLGENQAYLAPPVAARFIFEQMRARSEAGDEAARLWTLYSIAPEQTRRMSRTPDMRADLYSLGVAFYQILTGRLPFESQDALELVHSHLAKTPMAPHIINGTIAPILSEIVLKLLAKTPEERYQGTYGLLADLRECQARWQSNGRIEKFELGRRDVSERLQVPPRLYGRDEELAALHEVFARTRDSGEAALLLIGGYSGVGKTSLAQALRPLVAHQGGYFLSGKIDQFRRNLPYASLGEAFRGLVRQINTESMARIAQRRDDLQRSLGNNGQVIVDVIPEIELIIGPQPLVPVLAATEAMNRFHAVFQSFIGALARPGQPLVLFLDDLQWMDGASLKLLEALMGSARNLLVIGAFRDNEVSASHPLTATVERIEANVIEANVAANGNENAANIHRLTLAPLAPESVTQLLADTLHTAPEEAEPFSRLLVSKTDGNAFFLIQFLQALHTDGLLRFDRSQGRWAWDARRIQQADISSDVVELMAGKIRKLSSPARAALTVAACLGNRFELETLALVHGQQPAETLADLQELLDAGLLLAADEETKDEADAETVCVIAFRFLHDRVQQAAYSLLSEGEKSAIHERAGRLLAAQAKAAGEAVFEERLFDIANHLNNGRSYLTGEDAQLELADINLRAARKAKNALAYEGAAKYAAAGLALLPGGGWRTQHNLTLDLHLELGECEVLQGQFGAAEVRFTNLFEQTQDRFEKARVYLLQLISYTTQTRMAEATQTGVAALREFGIHLPENPGKGAVISAVLQARLQLGRRRASELLQSPPMTDPDAIAASRIIQHTLAAAFQSNVLLWTLLTLSNVGLALRFGNGEAASQSFGNYSIILCAPLGQYDSGRDFAELAMRLSDRPEGAAAVSAAYFTVGAFIHFWHYPFADGIALMQHSYESGPQNGEFVYSSYSALHMVFHRLFKGESLNDVHRLIEQYFDFVRRVQYKEGPEYLGFFRQFIACLQGRTNGRGSFANENYDEAGHVLEITNYVNKLPLMYYTVLKMEALFLLGETEQARRVAVSYERDPKNIEQFASMLFGPAFHFYNAMTLAVLYPRASTRQKRRYRLTLEMNRRRFQKWAKICPQNFAHLEALLGAELARLGGNWPRAQVLYEKAIAYAEKYDFTHHAALTHERAGSMNLAHGARALAAHHLNAARNGFTRWGASEKVRLLNEQYGVLLNPVRVVEAQSVAPVVSGETSPDTASPTSFSAEESTEGAISAKLDLSTVIKASQAISGEIEWARLLRVLINIAIENAGAQRGLLLLDSEGELRLAAEGEAGAVEVQPLEGRPFTEEDAARLLPLSVVNYVARTRESVVLANASEDELFAADPFIAGDEARSILCTPIVHQGRLLGVLYLQNDLAAGAFTEERLRILTLLAAQAAVSLEAARAYAHVRKSENQLHSIVNNATTVVYMKDIEGRYLLVNSQFAKLFDRSAEELLGATDVELFQPEAAAGMRLHDEQVLREGRPYEWEEDVVTKGIRRTYISVKFPLFDAEGTVYAVGGVSTDITERKRAEQVLADYNRALEEQVTQRTVELREKNQQLQRTLDQLQDAQERMVLQQNLAYLGTLTAGIAHEIQNPLNFVINFAQISTMLAEDLRGQIEEQRAGLAPQAHEYLSEVIGDLEQNSSKINEHGQRINNIVRSMLMHSRGISPAAAPANINMLLDEALELVYHAQHASKPDLNIHFEKEFDPVLDKEKLPVVAQDLSRVFTNIIGNASYAVQKQRERRGDGFVPTVKLTTRDTQGRVEIHIRDNGGGISPLEREQIFKPFFTTKPTGEGTGLGLSICYDIIAQEHAGELKVISLTDDELASEDGEGFAEFIIYLPKPTA